MLALIMLLHALFGGDNADNIRVLPPADWIVISADNGPNPLQ